MDRPDPAHRAGRDAAAPSCARRGPRRERFSDGRSERPCRPVLLGARPFHIRPDVPERRRLQRQTHPQSGDRAPVHAAPALAGPNHARARMGYSFRRVLFGRACFAERGHAHRLHGNFHLHRPGSPRVRHSADQSCASHAKQYVDQPCAAGHPHRRAFRPGPGETMRLTAALVLVAGVAMAAEPPRMPMTIEFANSAEFGWLGKKVLSTRPLDDMSDPATWSVRGQAKVAWLAPEGPAPARRMRVEMQMFHDQPPPTRNGLAAVNLRRAFPGEDWSAYNRISFWIRPELSGFPMLPIEIVMRNDGREKIPDVY